MHNLRGLIEHARAYLALLGYSELSIRGHEYSWRRLLEWCATYFSTMASKLSCGMRSTARSAEEG